MHWTIEEQIAEADKVLTRFGWTGTHGGDFFGAAASGRKVSVWGMVIDRLENGRITHTRILMDTLGLMQQIGG
jgi:predicted ester cyclase